MAKILVVEDDPTVRELMRMHLESAGFVVATAEDGESGLRLALSDPPGLIVADVRMPKLDGFGMLGALRSSPQTAAVPLIFVSALEDRESYRHGMDLGADDFLAKPVRGEELLRAVRGRLRRAQMLRETGERTVIATALEAQGPGGSANDALNRAQYEPALSQSNMRIARRELKSGSVMIISVRNASAMSRGLNAAERSELLQAFFSRLCEPILAQHGWVVRHHQSELVAMFESPADRLPDHANRALRAALLAVLSTYQFRTTLRARADHRGRHHGQNGKQAREAGSMDVSIGVAVHSGEVEISSLSSPSGIETSLAGPVVETLNRIEPHVAPLGWSVTASGAAADQAGADFKLGRVATLADTSIELVEIDGFDSRFAGLPGFSRVFDAIEHAVRANGALAHFDGAKPSRDASKPRVDVVPDYCIVRKLGQGGMSRVYLARREEDGAVQVLKITSIDEDEPDALQRFIQEYALVAQIRHPNVARIFGQGFAEHCAYIAMEYLDGGDLRARIDAGITFDQCLRHLTHLALALTALHERAIVHRDLKPENLMLRADGTLVLADFGIAKQAATHLTKTRHGEVFGTPFYMSPEQARGHEVDHRSDLYSAGVILYEMLTGTRPFMAPNAEAIVYQHVHADIPSLPGRYWRLQPVLDRLLAKRPEERFPSALELLREVETISATVSRSDVAETAVV